MLGEASPLIHNPAAKPEASPFIRGENVLYIYLSPLKVLEENVKKISQTLAGSNHIHTHPIDFI